MTLSVWDLSILWPLLGAIMALILGHQLWNLTYFRRRGIKGPTPLPFIGNVYQWFNGVHWILIDYAQKYGPIYGLFFFSNPALVISDLDMVRDITVKNFTKFMNHKENKLTVKPFDKAVTSLRGEHWKNVRNVLTPAFSTVKIKQMSALVNDCCDNLVKNFGEMQQRDNQVDVFKLFETFTMDGLARCAFGLQVDSQSDPDDPFVTSARKILSGSLFNPKVLLAAMFPSLGNLMMKMNIELMPSDVLNFFISVIDKTIAMRKQTPHNERKDFLQLMVDVHDENEGMKPEKNPEEHGDQRDLHSLVDEHHDVTYFGATRSKKKTLTTEEIYGQAIIFFIAGYAPVNTTLGFITYVLATNPEVQEKLIAEIDEVTPTRESVKYTSIANMPYLDGVVCETMRLYPGATMIERECCETHSYNGTTFEKGTSILIPVFAIHRDPAIWPNPTEFDPTRYFKENREGRHPFAWMPFGAGPRNCIGMRFALMETKMAIVRLLQKYRFETSPATQIPVKFGRNSVKPDPKDSIILCVVERS